MKMQNSSGFSNYDSDFINIMAWNSQAVFLSKFAKKGDRVEIVGRWEVERYTDSNGTQQVAHKSISFS